MHEARSEHDPDRSSGESPLRRDAAEQSDPAALSGEHGYTAEDGGGVGHGEEGFRAEEYPGNNPLRGESDRERRHRETVTWTWPRVDPEVREEPGSGAHADERICREIGRRIERAEALPIQMIVRVIDGEVTIEGKVATLEDKHVIEGVAQTVEGVRSLESRIASAD